jgi:hypothetical protein
MERKRYYFCTPNVGDKEAGEKTKGIKDKDLLFKRKV